MGSAPSAPSAPSASAASADGPLDHAAVDWSRAAAVTFELRQVLRYDYPGPVADLAHRLMVVPPGRHGDQRRVDWSVAVDGAAVRQSRHRDRFGNLVVGVRAARVAGYLAFDVAARVERVSGGPVPLAHPRRHRWLAASRLTAPDRRLEAVARGLAAEAAGGHPLGLALRIGGWVHQALEYRHDVTGVHTSAAEALALGAGVCQDYAHLMLALCHLCGIPARYVSGHLLGEGGSHAWVEVLVEGDRRDGAVAVAFDPTHDRVAGLSYLTVAVGRDYADVAPTSGTFRAPFPGRLTVTKRLALTSWRP